MKAAFYKVWWALFFFERERIGFFHPPLEKTVYTPVFMLYLNQTKGAVALAQAVLTGLLGSWNERTRPTEWD